MGDATRTASVWVGDAPDEAALEAVLAPEVTCDLEPLGSAFSRAASAPALADAVREVKLTEATVQTGELLAGLSFSRALASALPTTLAVPCRAVVIFYRDGLPASGDLRARKCEFETGGY